MDEAVKTFVSFTGARSDQAKYYLCKSKGNIEVAVGYYFDEITSKAAFQEQIAKPKTPRAVNQPMDEEIRVSNTPASVGSRVDRSSHYLAEEVSQGVSLGRRQEPSMSSRNMESSFTEEQVADQSRRNAFEVINMGTWCVTRKQGAKPGQEDVL